MSLEKSQIREYEEPPKLLVRLARTVAAAAACAAYAAFRPLTFSELLAGGKARKQQNGDGNDGGRHYLASFAFGAGRKIAQITKMSMRIATAVQTPKVPEMARRPSW